MGRTLEDIIDQTQTRITDSETVGPADDEQFEDDPELFEGEDTDDSEDDELGDDQGEYDPESSTDDDDDEDIDVYIGRRIEEGINAAVTPLLGAVQQLQASITANQNNNANTHEQQMMQAQMRRIVQGIASLPPEKQQAAVAKLTEAAAMQVVRENQSLRNQQTASAQQVADVQRYESTLQFIADGGRWVPDKADPSKGQYVQDAAAKLTPEEVEEMREYVRDDGWTMEKWADARLKARGARRARTKTLTKTLTKREAATPRVKGRGNAKPTQTQPATTVEDVAAAAAERVAQGMRRRR